MEHRQPSWISSRLAASPTFVLTFYAIAVSFSTYFCMYAFRKPFSAAKFEGLSFFGTDVELKTALVISQIIGYAISKYVGIKICSEIKPHRRAVTLVLLILWAQIALLTYGLVPDNWKFVAIFFNGLPLGMVWGMVVWYLEGRRTSEMLLAGLSCSFIMASGMVKDVGRWLMGSQWQISEGWMPAVTGCIFMLPFFLSVWLLNQIPKPTEGDISARTQRETMDGAHRLAFVKQFFFGLLLLITAYFFLTAYRDYRDNYQVEILENLGYNYEDHKTMISQTETMVAFGVLGVLAMLNLIKNNRWGLIGAYVVMTSGVVMLGASTWLFDQGLIDGYWWMTFNGLGSYLAYVPYGSVLFDRLIASTRVVGTAVFAIYVADAIGYTGSIGIQLYKDFGGSNLSRLEFFHGFTYFMSLFGAVMLVASCIYFILKQRGETSTVA